MIDKNQYIELCEACNKILLLPNTQNARVAIPWLHVIREHPIILARYRDLFLPERSMKKTFSQIKFVVRCKVLWCRAIYRAINCNGQLWFTKDKLPENVDYLFISHLLNSNQYSQKEDFYFGSMPNDLIKNNRSVAVASICHFSIRHSIFNKKFVKSRVPRLFLSSSLNLKSEIAIRKRLKKEANKLKRLAQKEQRSLYKSILRGASKEALSTGAQATLRFEHQIHALITRLRPKVIVLPYEGHAFERIAFAAAREVSLNIKCISYQITGVFRMSNAIRRTLSAQYNPDIILTAGLDGKQELEKSVLFKNIPISVLGSTRGIVEHNGMPITKRLKGSPVCLVIPEGFESECIHLFKFSLACALQRQDITFIWRLHPSLSFEKLGTIIQELNNLPHNIILSSDSIEKDIGRCAWVLYRGSTAIYKAISEGLRPLYLKLPNEISIDPLYKMQKWRMVINSPVELLSCISDDIGNNFKHHKSNLKMAKAICENQFAKLNIEALSNVVIKRKK
tara:strand:+ start:5764 stop:7290 length:1527 start_codon:yes stop_codon:yes gene_type:complete